MAPRRALDAVCLAILLAGCFGSSPPTNPGSSVPDCSSWNAPGVLVLAVAWRPGPSSSPDVGILWDSVDIQPRLQPDEVLYNGTLHDDHCADLHLPDGTYTLTLRAQTATDPSCSWHAYLPALQVDSSMTATVEVTLDTLVCMPPLPPRCAAWNAPGVLVVAVDWKPRPDVRESDHIVWSSLRVRAALNVTGPRYNGTLHEDHCSTIRVPPGRYVLYGLAETVDDAECTWQARVWPYDVTGAVMSAVELSLDTLMCSAPAPPRPTGPAG